MGSKHESHDHHLVRSVVVATSSQGKSPFGNRKHLACNALQQDCVWFLIWRGFSQNQPINGCFPIHLTRLRQVSRDLRPQSYALGEQIAAFIFFGFKRFWSISWRKSVRADHSAGNKINLPATKNPYITTHYNPAFLFRYRKLKFFIIFACNYFGRFVTFLKEQNDS